MARKKQKAKNENEHESEEQHGPRPFWSGALAFGLVNLPVSLFPANRGKPLSLNMVDKRGHQLHRRYFCEKEEKMLERDEIVRGYPVKQDRYVIVEDEELEALEPRKTREIDLRLFVPLDEINPVFFERGYFLAPDSRATKAYRLLARSLEEEQRAGIATFVMRDREYLVAIMAEGGILRAETLRFPDEIRSPQQVGLPTQTGTPDRKLEQNMLRAVKSLSREKLAPEVLIEQEVERLRKLVDDKLEKGDDVVEDDQAPDPDAHDDSNVIDLMQILKERLRGQTGSSGREKARGKSRLQGGKSRPSGARAGQPSRDELYEKARKKRIPGRSRMNKNELVKALEKAG